MRTRVVILCLSIASQVGLASVGRIVGGTKAEPGEFPSIVSLQRSSHFCGGSLIEKNWVLTAAHCVKGASTSSLKIRVGLFKQGDFTGVETFSAKKVVVHPDYSSSKSDYDFALVQLSGDSTVVPIELNGQQLNIADEEENAAIATTAGWGVTSEGSGSIPSSLMRVDVPLVSAKRCEAAYPGKITKTMVCAGFTKGGKDSCQGDSGGPLYVKQLSGQRVLAGVVSWGEGCARPKKFGVYADVFTVLDWVDEQTSVQ